VEGMYSLYNNFSTILFLVMNMAHLGVLKNMAAPSAGLENMLRDRQNTSKNSSTHLPYKRQTGKSTLEVVRLSLAFSVEHQLQLLFVFCYLGP